MRTVQNIVLLGLFFPLLAFAAGSSEGAASSTRGSYLSDMGYIIRPDEIRIESYISQIDYDYPLPDGDPINVITAADFKDSNAYIQIGLKGKKLPFSELPPLNLAFVIDKSGSMLDYDKMDWVKDSFRVFADQVRPQDFISLVVFDTRASVLIPAGRIRNYQERQQFVSLVNSIRASGGTNVYDGMQLGYEQVAANFSREYINRVICLTDGEHNSGNMGNDDILNLAEQYNRRNITISTIALGASADIPLMVDIAIQGGGSSRFISDHTAMVKTFGSELDRLLVPAARMLRMDLALSSGVRLRETWGYEHTVTGNTIHYTLDTLHNGDYETLVAEVQISPREPVATTLGNFSLEYLDENNIRRRQGPYPVVLEAGAIRNSSVITNPRIKESEGYIVLGRGLTELGRQAQDVIAMQQEYNRLRNQPSSASQPSSRNQSDSLLSFNDNVPSQSPATLMRNRIIRELEGALSSINYLSAYLADIRASLGGNKYGDEIQLLDNYRVSFSGIRDSYTAIQND
jgi:hypothetical protein